jgi:hypothetical protein
MKENRPNYLFLLSIPYVMAFSSVAGYSIGTIRHTGLYWMATGIAAFFLIPLKGGGKITFPWWYWAPFYLVMGFSLTATGFDLRENVQLLFQITVCFLVGIVASFSCRSLDIINRLRPHYIAASLILSAFCVYYMLGPGRVYQAAEGSLYQGFADRPASCSLIVIASLFLGDFRRQPWLGLFVWFFCVLICFISESRMTTFLLLTLWVIHPTIVTLKARLVLVVLVLASVVFAFNTPIIQDRFFNKKSGYSGQGSLEDVFSGKFDSSGRFDAWPKVFSKSIDRFWTGHGIGESAPFVFRVWAPMDKPHNEYLKMFFEGGIIGLATYVLGLLGILANLYWCQWKTGDTNWVCAAAIMAWVSFILMSFVDNTSVYGGNFTHPLFFLVGAANGITASILAKEKDAAAEGTAPANELKSQLKKSERPELIMLR